MQHHLRADMLASVLRNASLRGKSVQSLTCDHLDWPTESLHVGTDLQIEHASVIVRVSLECQLGCASERVEHWLNSDW